MTVPPLKSMKSIKAAGKILQALEKDEKQEFVKISKSSVKIMTENKSAKRGPFKLKLGTISLYPFVQHSFTVQVFLLDNFQQLVCG